MGYCVEEEKECMRWVEKYFKDCLCNMKEELSFGFGIISLVCWGVAEIPQIVTNFRSKSGHRISLLFLLILGGAVANPVLHSSALHHHNSWSLKLHGITLELEVGVQFMVISRPGFIHGTWLIGSMKPLSLIGSPLEMDEG